MYSSIIPRRSFESFGEDVCTFMPGSASVVQDAGVPRRPSTSTRHKRQDPNASTLSVAHSFGTCTPASTAARMTDEPAGTVTGLPSISSVTKVSATREGVP